MRQVIFLFFSQARPGYFFLLFSETNYFFFTLFRDRLFFSFKTRDRKFFWKITQAPPQNIKWSAPYSTYFYNGVDSMNSKQMFDVTNATTRNKVSLKHAFPSIHWNN